MNLEQAIEFPEDLVPENISELPTALEVKRVVDLAGRFRGVKTIVEDAESAFVDFYREVGQQPDTVDTAAAQIQATGRAIGGWN